MARSESAALEWSLRGATVHELPLPWFGDESRWRDIQALKSEVHRESRAPKKRDDAFIEAAVARGYIADGWHERVFRGIPKTPDTFGLPLIHQSALVPLACNPAGMMAAESIARSIFHKRHLLWSAASIVDIAAFVKPTPRSSDSMATAYMQQVLSRGSARRPRIQHTLSAGIVRWQRRSTALVGLDHYLTAQSAVAFWYRLSTAHPEWVPLLDLGVVPWLVDAPERYKVVLLCPETPMGITIRWVQRTYRKPPPVSQ